MGVTPAQFALFRQVGPNGTQYIVGVEDLAFDSPGSDRDYNDQISRFTIRRVPEPATLLLMGAAFGGVALRRRRR